MPAAPAIPLDLIDPHALSAVRRLRSAGYKAYLVGGCVRDLLLELTPKDFDIATEATPEEIRKIFRNSRIIGRRFRLVHLYFREGKVIEVSTFRATLPTDEDPASTDLMIRRDNVFGSEEEDARRRDFTINGLFYDVVSGEIIDHVGGRPDIEARYLRMIGDPEIRLREDPVRILRAIRFIAKTSLNVEPSLREAMRRHRAELAQCAPARLLEETLRLLRIGHAERIMCLLEETEVLDVLLPEIAAYLRPSTTASRESRATLDGAEQGDVPPLANADPDAPQDAQGLRCESKEAPATDTGDIAQLGLLDFEEGELRHQRLYAHLEALDRLIRREPVSDAVALAALLAAPIRDLETLVDGFDRQRAVVAFIAAIGERIALTRRLSEQLRLIFTAQRHFADPRAGVRRRSRSTPSPALLRRGFFLDALRLYEIRVQAEGLPSDQLIAWQQLAETQHLETTEPVDDDTEAPPTRPLKRSTRRPRRRRTASRPS